MTRDEKIVAATVSFCIDSVTELCLHYVDEHVNSEREGEIIKTFCSALVITLGTIKPDLTIPDSDWFKEKGSDDLHQG